MNSNKKKLIVEIFSDQYVLISDEKEEHITCASILVDEIMNEIAKKSNLVDSKRIAVLTALRLASELITLKSSVSDMHRRKEKLIALINKEGLSSSV